MPAALLISAAMWTLGILLLPDEIFQQNGYLLWQRVLSIGLPEREAWLFCFCLYLIAGYFLIGLNNAYAIIRTRASLQTSIFLLLVAACPCLHAPGSGTLVAVAFLMGLFFLFRTYQQPHPSNDMFLAFACFGTGSLLLPQLTLFMPVLWMGAYLFQAFNAKSFCASLVGWCFPYWLLAGHAFCHDQMELFYAPFLELARFQAPDFSFQPWVAATLAYLLILYVAGTGHYLASTYMDKIRTRSYLYFLILLCGCIFLYILLQPVTGTQMLPILMIGVSILTGHLFVLTDTRESNVFFIVAFTGIFLLEGFNLWTLS